MKKIIIFTVFLFIFCISVYSKNIYNLFIKGDIKAVEMKYDSLNERKMPINDSLLFYFAELTENVAKSIAAYTRIVNGFPNSPFYYMSHFRLAKYYFFVNDTINAMDFSKKLLHFKNDTITPFTYIMLIGYYEKQGQIKKNAEIVEQFRKDYPSHFFLKNYDIEGKKHSKSLNAFYSIQLGAYRDKANAQKASEEYRKKGYDAFVYADSDLYKVMIGKFEKRENALDYQKIFQKAEGAASFIVEVK